MMLPLRSWTSTHIPILFLLSSCGTRLTQSQRVDGTWLSPQYNYIFQYPVPFPPVKAPKFTYTNDNGANIDYYEMEVTSVYSQIYPELAETELIGYDGISPGPMFVMQQGKEAVVRFTNNGPVDMSVHVHGQYNRAPFDGWAGDFATPGQYKDYYYPNTQNARTIWYHDHTEYKTGENVYRGQEGLYLIHDAEEQGLGLPSGNYDVPLSLSAKVYDKNGALVYNTNNNIGLWGDVIQVNGQPWPYLNVEPRKYRLRLLNGAVSRTFGLSFTAAEENVSEGDSITFMVIASDGGLFGHPVKTNYMAMAMGERYEVIFDFSKYQGKNITLRNARGMGENVDYAATDLIMRFVVGDTVSDSSNNGDIPSSLHNIPPPPDKTESDKDFTFERVRGGRWNINGVGFADVENRILTKPDRGMDEIWTLKNGAGDGTHPVHIHLIDFQILSRTGGRNAVRPYESAGMKDIVWLAGGETVKVLARYAPWPGVYMFHCHNLVHEDYDMLAAFNVTQLSDWGYDNGSIFIDPMSPEFRPKDVSEDDYTDEAIREKLDWLYNTDPYNHGDVDGVYSALDDWAAGGNPTPARASETPSATATSESEAEETEESEESGEPLESESSTPSETESSDSPENTEETQNNEESQNNEEAEGSEESQDNEESQNIEESQNSEETRSTDDLESNEEAQNEEPRSTDDSEDNGEDDGDEEDQENEETIDEDDSQEGDDDIEVEEEPSEDGEQDQTEPSEKEPSEEDTRE